MSNEKPLPKQYLPDCSISDPSQDKFQRSSFATQLSRAIVTSEDPEGIVMGLYGAWGEGKSSVLNLMESKLKENSNVITIRYNPWRLGTEAQLIYGFFETIATTLDKEITTKSERFGEKVKTLGKYLSGIKNWVDIEAIGESLSSADLEDLKTRIEGFLNESKKRVIIIMDDIDRLESSEVHTIFNLVKMAANFNYVTYVLAFDDEMVAAALSQKYAGVSGGRAFLEKIIQVPLRLPKAPDLALRAFLFENVEHVLTDVDISWSPDDRHKFRTLFLSALEPRMRTPRALIRYVNALRFALPLLKQEAHLVDLMLIEALRLSWPTFYETVRANRHLFVTDWSLKTEGSIKWAEGVFKELVGGSVPQERWNLLEIVGYLFPNMVKIGARGTELYNLVEATQAKKICTEEYFDRYFTYHATPSILPHAEVEVLLHYADEDNFHLAEDQFQKIATPSHIIELIHFLMDHISKLSSNGRSKILDIVIRNAILFQHDETALRTAGDLVRMAFRLDPDNIDDYVHSLVTRSNPFYFVVPALGLLGEHEDPRLDAEIITEPRVRVFVERLEDKFFHTDRFSPFTSINRGIVRTWVRWGTTESLRKKLDSRLEYYPELAVDLILMYTPNSVLEEFQRSGALTNDAFYDRLSEIVDPQVLRPILDEIVTDSTLAPEIEKCVAIRAFIEAYNRRMTKDAPSLSAPNIDNTPQA